jgi:hypothetical protein
MPARAEPCQVSPGLRCEVKSCLGRPRHAMPAVRGLAQPSPVMASLALPAMPRPVTPCQPKSRLAWRRLRSQAASRAVSPVLVMSCLRSRPCPARPWRVASWHACGATSRGVWAGLVTPCLRCLAAPSLAKSRDACDAPSCLVPSRQSIPVVPCLRCLVSPSDACGASSLLAQFRLAWSRHVVPATPCLVMSRVVLPSLALRGLPLLVLRCLRPGVSRAIPVRREGIKRRLGQIFDTRDAVLL